MLITHPDNLESLKTRLLMAGGYPALYGTAIRAIPGMPKHASKWAAPTERFVEYEASDEPWLRYFKIGQEVVDPSKMLILQVWL